MTQSRCRSPMLAAAIVLAALAPRPAPAQDVYLPMPIHLPADYLIAKKYEWLLQRDRARLREDLDRGDAVAVNGDLNRIQHDARRIWYFRREFREDSFHRPGPWVPAPAPIPMGTSLIPDPQHPGYGYHPADPEQLYRLPPTSPSPVPTAVTVVIASAAARGTAMDYEVDGARHTIEGGRTQTLRVGQESTILYDRGGGLGLQRYELPAGTYEFRPGDAGWTFVRLSSPP